VLRIVSLALALCALSLGGFAIAQEQPGENKNVPHEQGSFFSGNVVSVTAEKVVVSRRTLSLTTVSKTFTIDGNTKVEGKLQPKARVTVKFEKTDAGDHAVHIVVR
jgi:hypothetical protein